METVMDLLREHPRALVTTVLSETVLDATRRMNDEHVGSVLVMDGGRLVGIFTERDVLRRVVGDRRAPERTAVADVMTSDVVCCPPESSIDDVAELMRTRRIRHVPIVDADGFVVGLVSIGDVNASRFSRCEMTLHQVEDYVWRRA
ncbi:MAG: CBS domain-containing protein [Planctomycetia bacterium]